MNKKIYLTAIVIAALLLMPISGCTRFQVGSYAQASLDARYKQVYTDYMRYSGKTQEGAEEYYEENLNSLMETLDQYELSDTLKKSYRELFANIMNQARYESESQEKTDDGEYTITFSVEPLKVFEGVEEELQAQSQAYYDAIAETAGSGSVSPTEDQTREAVYQMLYNILAARMESPEYGEAQKIQVHVHVDDMAMFEIPEGDLKAVDNLVINLTEMGLQ